MSKRRAKLNTATVKENICLRISDADWHRIELAYRPLPERLRNEILAATQWYLESALAEGVAEPVKTAVQRIKGVERTGDAFLKALDTVRGSQSEQMIFQKFGNTDRINLFYEMMQSYLKACRLVLDQVTDPTSHGWIEGSAWASWVVDLTQIMRTHGLPHQARKDVDKKRKDIHSKFVALLRELQTCFPKKFRRGWQSDDALATAINRARATVRVGK
jgi:hypothetical protein